MNLLVAYLKLEVVMKVLVTCLKLVLDLKLEEVVILQVMNLLLVEEKKRDDEVSPDTAVTSSQILSPRPRILKTIS